MSLTFRLRSNLLALAAFGLAACGGTNVSPTLSSMTIAPANPSVAIGHTVSLSVSGTLSDGTTTAISDATWSSSVTGIATVNATGTVTGIAAGTATITATSSTVSATTVVTVTAPTVTSIAVTPATATIAPAATQALAVTATFSDSTTATVTASATYASSSTATATVSAAGVVTGVAAGTSTITATYQGKTATSAITVSATAPTLSSIAITPASPIALTIAGTQQLTVTGTFSNSTTQNLTSTSTFSSATPAAATVSNIGVVTAVAAGSSVITATNAGKTATVTVNVTAATLSSIAVTPSPVSIKVNGTQALLVTGTFSDNSHANVTTNSTFVSGTPAVATVATTGIVTGVAGGSSVITVTDAGKTTTVTVTVAAPVLQSIASVPASLSLAPAATSQLAIKGTFDTGTSDVTASATFTSGNTAFATVSAGGLVTAVANGTTSIAVSVTPAGGTAVTTSVPVTVAAAVPDASVVYVNGYGAGVVPKPFDGSVNDLSEDSTTTLDINGHKSLKIVYPSTAYTGETLVDESGTPRDLSGFDSVTFWAKASAAGSIAVLGIGNNGNFSAHNGFDVELHGTAVTTAWQQFTMPLPDPSKLTATDGLFHFADGSHQALTVWLADIQYKHAGNLGAATPAWANTAVSVPNGQTYTIQFGDLQFNMSPPSGPVTLSSPNTNYFTFTSDNSVAATVNGTVVTNANTSGSSATANITAHFGAVATANHLTVTAAGVPSAAAPTTLPPVPTQSATNVISLYSSVSGGYNGTSADKSANVDTWHTCWTPGPVTGGDPFPITVGAQSAGPRKYTVLPNENSYVGIEFIGKDGDVCTGAINGNHEIDVSGMDHFHIDVWTPNISDNFQVKLVDAGANKQINGQDTFGIDTITQGSTPPLATGKWLSYDVPLSNGFGASNWQSPPANLKQLAQMVLQAPAGGTFFVDNIYFYKTVSSGATGPTTLAATPTAAANTVLSLFSSAYTGISGTDVSAKVDSFAASCFGPPGTTVADFTIPGTSHVVKQYGIAGSSFAIIELIGSTGANGTPSGTDSPICTSGATQAGTDLNVSAMTTVHFDIWSPAAAGNFQVHLVGADSNGFLAGAGAPSGAGGGSTFVSGANSLNVGAWNSFDVPLSQLGVPVSGIPKLALIKFFTSDAGTYYLDNVYFHQ